jgi:lysophospholipase L1-like esterase
MKFSFQLTVSAAVVAAAAASSVCAAQTGRESAWVGTWASSFMAAPEGNHTRPFALTTLRQIVHISNGGDRVRIRFTNAYGVDPLTLADVHIGISSGSSSIEAKTDHAVTFGGAASVRIAPGAEVYSDPVLLAAPPLSDLAISFFIPNQVMRAETYHDFANETNYVVDGDMAGAASLNGATTIDSWYFVDGVDVPAVESSRAIVAVGDSITDGALSTKGANSRWPDVLAERLKKVPGLENVAVLNQGINGNRVLNQGYGPSALSRLDRDVLAQNGAKYVIVLEGINDIGRLARPLAPEDDIAAENLEFGMRQIVDIAHEHGLKALGATLTPYGGAGYYSDKGEQIRETVNEWIRTSGVFDGVIDFDKITQDPANPKRFNSAYDSGDHLHPNDAGYKAMGEGIDLMLFAK